MWRSRSREIVTLSGGVARLLVERAADLPTVLDYIPTSLHSAIKAKTSTTDVTEYIQDALDANVGWFPRGRYCVIPGLTLPSDIEIASPGRGVGEIRLLSAPGVTDVFLGTSKANISVRNITFDGAGLTATGNGGLMAFQNCTDWEVVGCEFKGFDRFALVFNGGARFLIDNNRFYRTATAPTQNQSILGSLSAGTATFGKITNNHARNSAFNIGAAYSSMIGNTIEGFAFGAGITTEQHADCHDLLIAFNGISGGTGTDANGYRCGGIENWAAKTVIAGNICRSNSGAGIEVGGQRSVEIGNICYNNGITGGNSGIVGRYGTATYNGSNSLVVNNMAFDESGASGTQTYGYGDQSSSIDGVQVGGNNFNDNKTGNQNLLGSLASVHSQSLYGSKTWDPGSVMSAGVPATTTVTVTGAALGDIVRASFSLDLQGLSLTGYVSSANTVTVSLANLTAGAVDLGSGTLVVQVDKTPISVQY